MMAEDRAHDCDLRHGYVVSRDCYGSPEKLFPAPGRQMTVGEKQNDNRQHDDRGTAYRIQHERDGAQRESVMVQRVDEHGVAPAD